jgi:hypothetical protein
MDESGFDGEALFVVFYPIMARTSRLETDLFRMRSGWPGATALVGLVLRVLSVLRPLTRTILARGAARPHCILVIACELRLQGPETRAQVSGL